MVDESYKLRVKEASAAKNYSKNDEYYTPKIVFDRTIGRADYDPATNTQKAREFGIPIYDTIETDGLKSDWNTFNRIWINPPFTLKKEFIRKAIETLNLNKKANIFILVPIETLATNWFYDLNIDYDLWIPRGRIKFEDPRNPKAKSPAFGSVIIELSNNSSNKINKFEL